MIFIIAKNKESETTITEESSTQ